jgi:alkylation response protein AidB-like acyl-CoA dehydrogenase
VLEELLAAGAPVSAHWIADRQSGPLLLRFGTEAMRRDILPGIARGETYFCIGMSEPNSGSDLASVRTRAVPETRDGVPGWIVNGTKVWTTMAQHAHYMIALVRTSGSADDRHAGLSQLLIDLSNPAVTVRPIVNLAGDAEYNEVSFVDAFVPETMLIGNEGEGWAQVMSELAYERSGPERYLSSMQLFVELVRAAGPEPDDRAAAAIGRLAAHLASLRDMSLSVAAMLQAGRSPDLEAALVKEVGVGFEQEIPDIVHAVMDSSPRLGGSDLERVMAYTAQVAPSFSLRGGTREIVRGIIARGLGLR